MIPLWRKAPLVLLLFLLAPAVMAQTAATSTPPATSPQPAHRSTKARRHKRPEPKPSPVAVELPPPPPPPLRPEQMPAVPPEVTYSNGLLTIVATNSTLSDILHLVSARTGATLDAPAPLMGERVAIRLGPAPPREVLSDLLASPRLDYILVGADGDPNAVRSIILSANQSSPVASNRAIAQPQPAPMPSEEADDDSDDAPSPINAAGNPADAGRKQYAPQPPPEQTAPPATTSGEGGTQPVRTPEQLLEQLRRMQQPPGAAQPPQQPQN